MAKPFAYKGEPRDLLVRAIEHALVIHAYQIDFDREVFKRHPSPSYMSARRNAVRVYKSYVTELEEQADDEAELGYGGCEYQAQHAAYRDLYRAARFLLVLSYEWGVETADLLEKHFVQTGPEPLDVAWNDDWAEQRYDRIERLLPTLTSHYCSLVGRHINWLWT